MTLFLLLRPHLLRLASYLALSENAGLPCHSLSASIALSSSAKAKWYPRIVLPGSKQALLTQFVLPSQRPASRLDWNVCPVSMQTTALLRIAAPTFDFFFASEIFRLVSADTARPCAPIEILRFTSSDILFPRFARRSFSLDASDSLWPGVPCPPSVLL